MSLELKYFVLKPSGDSEWAKASRVAMRVFASEMEQHDLTLASEIKQWVYNEERKLHKEKLSANG